jgi:hypothetical protein
MATDGKIPAAADADAATAKAPQSAYGGGGSAFAHLTEVAGTNQIRTDWSFLAATNPAGESAQLGPDAVISAWSADGDTYAQILPGHFYAQSAGAADKLLESWPNAADGNHESFRVDGDGSLHWGDGTAAPDTSLTRGGTGKLRTERLHASFRLAALAANEAGNAVEAIPSGLYFWNDYATDAEGRLHIDATDGSLHWGDGTAAPDVSAKRTSGGGLAVSGADWFYVGDPDVAYVGIGDISGTGRQGIEFYDGTQTRDLIIDADGDLAISGVGKISTH